MRTISHEADISRTPLHSITVTDLLRRKRTADDERLIAEAAAKGRITRLPMGFSGLTAASDPLDVRKARALELLRNGVNASTVASMTAISRPEINKIMAANGMAVQPPSPSAGDAYVEKINAEVRAKKARAEAKKAAGEGAGTAKAARPLKSAKPSKSKLTAKERSTIRSKAASTPRTDRERELTILDAYMANPNFDAVAREHACSPRTIKRILRDHGMSIPPTKRRLISRTEIVSMHQSGMTGAQISAALHCDPTVVSRALKLHGIKPSKKAPPLPVEQVREMAEMYATGVKAVAVARKFKIGLSRLRREFAAAGVEIRRAGAQPKSGEAAHV